MRVLISHKLALCLSKSQFKKIRRAFREEDCELLIIQDARRYYDIKQEADKLVNKFSFNILDYLITTNTPENIVANLYLSHYHPQVQPWGSKIVDAAIDNIALRQQLEICLHAIGKYCWSPNELAKNRYSKTIAFDMDDVLMDIRGAFVKLANQLQIEALSKYKIEQNFPEKYQQSIVDTMKKPGFYASLGVLPGAVEMLERLKKHHGYQLLVCSSPNQSTYCIDEKFESINKHFMGLFDGVIVTRKKHVTYAKILVDDLVKYAKTEADIAWQKLVMMRAPHNTKTEWPYIMNSRHDLLSLLVHAN